MTDHLEEQWRASAQALGLALRKQTWRSHIADNFGAMMRSLGAAPSSDDEVRDSWMVGSRQGAHVVVAISWPKDLQLKMGRRASVQTTDVVVAIEPPLLLGLRVACTSSLGLRGGPDFDVGHGELDAKFEISAFSRERASRLLLPHAARLLSLQTYANEMLVTDNLVHVGFRGRFFEASALGSAVDSVIDAAHALSEERAEMPDVASELPYAAFDDISRDRGLSFDPARMKIEGDIHGITVELRFCTANGTPYFAARARLPRPLALTLRIGAQTSDDGATIFFDDDSPDIEIGDPNFDETFVVEASDEDRARAVLAAPSVRHAALDIVRAGGDVVVTDTYVAASIRESARMKWLLDHVVNLAGTLGGGSGPYR